MAAENVERAGDCGEESAEDETEMDPSNRAMNVPYMLAALQRRSPQQQKDALPLVMKRRIKALKKLQLAQTNMEADFFNEVHDLECRYHQLYEPMYGKREQIVAGKYEPNDEECEWKSDDEELSKEFEEKVKVEPPEAKSPSPYDENVKGIPDFWLTIFKNISLLAEMVEEHDEPILKHLQDIKTKLVSKPMGFILEFHFEPNEYFTNVVLTKEYDMKCVPDADDPFGFEGPEIYKCRGCAINWNKGKNVTLKTVKKKQKHKSRGQVRTVTKTVQNDSFFNFFNPPTIADDTRADDVDEETSDVLTTDFEIGHYLRERIIPRAVLYYTGDAGDDDFDEDDDDEEDEDDDEDEDDEEEVGGKNNGKAVANDQNCKQQ